MKSKLKVGDDIWFKVEYRAGKIYRAQSILKITPSGIIKTRSYTMTSDLKIRGAQNPGRSVTCLGKYPKEVYKRTKRNQLIDLATLACRKIKLDILSDEDLKSIVDMYQKQLGEKNDS
jgi:hypothetical protein